MKKSIYGWALLALLAALLCLGGCVWQEPEPQPSTIPTVPVTTAPKPVPLGFGNPMNIQGYTYFETPTVNPRGDVFLTAQLDADAKMDGKPLLNLSTHFWNGQSVLVEYTVEDGEESYSCGLSWLYGEGTPAVTSTFSYGSEIAHLGGGLVTVCDPAHGYVDCYGSGLARVGGFSLDGASAYALSGDGKRCYFVRRGALLCREGDDLRQILPRSNFCVVGIDSVITDQTGKDYANITCLGGDLEYYRGILECATGKVLRISGNDGSYIQLSRGTYVETLYDSSFETSRWIICQGAQKWDFRWEEDPKYRSVYVLDGGEVLFAEPCDNGLRLFLYKDGAPVNGTEFTVDNGHPVDPDSERGSVDLCQQPILLDANRMLLQLLDGAGNRLYYIWKLDTAVPPESALRVLPYALGSRPSAPEPGGLNMHDYTPKLLSEEWKPLRDRADELEKRWGIGIYLGSECAGIVGDYAVLPLTDHGQAEQALDILARELEKYPDNFFSQMCVGSMLGQDFYLAGDLYQASAGTLEDASGFQTEVDGRQTIVMDCNYLFFMSKTIHHEICHSIEDFMTALEWVDGVKYLDEEQWNARNPDAKIYGDCYSHTYEQFGYEKNWNLTYDMQLQSGQSVAGTYFVDPYSMTFPWEDRARLFQNHMADDPEVDFDAAPYLKAKLAYFLECMRRAYDSTGWTQAPWDRGGILLESVTK